MIIGRTRIVPVCTHHDHARVDCDGVAEPVARGAVGSRKLRHLPPVVGAALVAGENVGGAVIVRRPAVVPVGAHHCRVSVDRGRHTEVVVSRAPDRGDLRHLPPVVRSALVLFKDVGRPGLVARVIVPHCPHDERASVNRYGPAEHVELTPVSGGEFLRLSPPLCAPLVSGKDVSRALVGFHTDIGGVGANDDRVLVGSHGIAERVVFGPVPRRQLGSRRHRRHRARRQLRQDLLPRIFGHTRGHLTSPCVGCTPPVEQHNYERQDQPIQTRISHVSPSNRHSGNNPLRSLPDAEHHSREWNPCKP